MKRRSAKPWRPSPLRAKPRSRPQFTQSSSKTQSLFDHEPRTKPRTNHSFPNALNRDHPSNKIQLNLLGYMFKCSEIEPQGGILALHSLSTEDPRLHISEGGTCLSVMTCFDHCCQAAAYINVRVGCRRGAIPCFCVIPALHCCSICFSRPTQMLLNHCTLSSH